MDFEFYYSFSDGERRFSKLNVLSPFSELTCVCIWGTYAREKCPLSLLYYMYHPLVRCSFALVLRLPWVGLRNDLSLIHFAVAIICPHLYWARHILL